MVTQTQPRALWLICLLSAFTFAQMQVFPLLLWVTVAKRGQSITYLHITHMSQTVGTWRAHLLALSPQCLRNGRVSSNLSKHLKRKQNREKIKPRLIVTDGMRGKCSPFSTHNELVDIGNAKIIAGLVYFQDYLKRVMQGLNSKLGRGGLVYIVFLFICLPLLLILKRWRSLLTLLSCIEYWCCCFSSSGYDLGQIRSANSS